MKQVESAQNPGFKSLVRLVGEPKVRRSSGLCWLEGERLVEAGQAALRGAGRHGRSEESAQALRVLEELPGLPPSGVLQVVTASGLARSQHLLDMDQPIWLLPDRLFAQLSQVEADQGIGLVMPKPSAQLSAVDEGDEGGEGGEGERDFVGGRDWVLLDRLQDPGNLGSLIRTAAAAGLRGVLLMEGTTEAFSPKALRSGMGGQFALDVVESVSESQLVAWLEAADKRRLLVQTVAPAEEGAQSLYGVPSPLRDQGVLVWAFGQEGSGLSAGLRALGGLRLSIPQSAAVESLNVAAAAAVCLFERRRLLTTQL